MVKTLSVKEKKIDASKPLKNVANEKFVQSYVRGVNFGNAIEAYAEIYRIDRKNPRWRNVASASASRLLTNAIVCERINFLLQDELSFNPQEADKQLSFLMSQHQDMRVKLGAIKEYNILKGRITRKLELSYADTSDEALEQELLAVEEEMKKTDAVLREVRSQKEKDTPGLPALTTEQRSKVESGELLP